MTDEVVLRFWTPISQLVPVLALAFVIEMRVQARNLPLDTRWLVRLQSFAWIISGGPLVVVEYWALDALANNAAKAELVALATSFVMSGIAGAVILPILTLLMTLNMDLVTAVGRHLREIFATPRRFRLRRRAEETLFESNKMRAHYLRVEEKKRKFAQACDDQLQRIELARMRAGDLSLAEDVRMVWRRWLANVEDKSEVRRQVLLDFADTTALGTEIDESHVEVVRVVEHIRTLRYDASAPAEEREKTVEYMKNVLDRLVSVR